MASRSKRKPRKPKPAGQPTRMRNIVDAMIAGTAASLIADGIRWIIQYLAEHLNQ